MAFDIHNPWKILKTNVIHLLGFYICIETSAIINVISAHGLDTWYATILSLVLGVPFFMFSYGLIVMTFFFLVVIVLDLILFSIIKNNILLIMVIEWVIIVPIFIYWGFLYEYWPWLWLSASFLVTQFIRSSKIKKVLNKA